MFSSPHQRPAAVKESCTSLASNLPARAGVVYRRRCDVRASAIKSVETDKARLLECIEGTERGGDAGAWQRAEVEEAQVSVELFSAGKELDWKLLEGTWRLVYTTASDVVPIVRTPTSLPVVSTKVYQRFTSPEEGVIQNIIELTFLAPIINETKVKFVVNASYSVRTCRSLGLRFQSAGIESIQLGPGAQNLLAPALLPRGFWNQQVLMALESASINIPLTTPSGLLGQNASSSSGRGVGSYMLTYLDDDMLIGRAQGSGGTFIFVREDCSS